MTATDSLADRRKHVQEDEHQEERLQDRAGQELLEVLLEHREIAQQQPGEGAPAGLHGGPAQLGALVTRERGRRGCGGCGGGHQSRSSFPVRLMNTVSSVGSLTVRSTSREPLFLTVSSTMGRASAAPFTCTRSSPSRATTLVTIRRRFRAFSSLSRSPLARTATMVSASMPSFRPSGVSRARMWPWSMIATRLQSWSASSM